MESETITAICPLGHFVHDDATKVGTWVNCPQCDAGFEFSDSQQPSVITHPTHAPSSVTDSCVMRILESDVPQQDPCSKQSQTDIAAESTPSDVVLSLRPGGVAAAVRAIRSAFAV
ncbi:hypothetical protein [Crateriforma conspicua]|uniref:Uncharacterized protein n=1 Tax=Crateriforma conspicua TaxID=2527996 RepID=A0A5C5Y0F1_9PLAN|nr:hypothetical protein [Crateriforma conspicua]QDV62909.1 hypothetical protein Mal65_20460 [Crateriforma conspicua]TWT68319.1 hypothetical protein Pan14r_05630 [Crateriforma conspicua]